MSRQCSGPNQVVLPEKCSTGYEFRRDDAWADECGHIRAAIRDVSRFGAEGARYAEMAAMWAATLMVAEICKLGLAAGDRRARVLFNAQDRLFGQANKLLKSLSVGTIATKDDVLKTLDPELRNVNQMTESVQKTRSLLKKIGVNENKETKLVLDLIIAMTHS